MQQPLFPKSSRTSPEPLPSLFLRMHHVTRMTGLCRSTIYRLVASNEFPVPIKLTSRAIAWKRSDVERWGDARPKSQRR